MASTNKEFTIKINGIDVAIKDTNDFNKAIKALEANLNNNSYGTAQIEQFQKTLEETTKKGEELKKELSKKAGFNITIEGVPQFLSTIAEVEKAKEELEEKLKSTDKGSAAFAQMTAELRNVNTEIEKFEVSVEFLTIDKIMGTAGAAVGAVSGAFATATSGAALFGKQMGIDADQVQEYADQADSLVAFLSGIQAVTSAVSGENLKNAKAVLQSAFAWKAQAVATTEATAATEGATVASKLFGTTAKAAIASTGIGLLLVAVVLLYEHFDTVTSAAKKFGSYIAPFVSGLTDGFEKLVGKIRDVASALTGGFINSAAKEKIQDNAQDQLDKLKKEEEFQRKAIDLQDKGEIERLKKTAEFEKKKLQLMKDSGDASVKEIKEQQQKIQEAEKASNEARKKFAEDQARKTIDLTSKTEGEKLRRVKELESEKLAELKKRVGEENQLYKEQLLVVQESNKSFLTQIKADAKERADKAKERYQQELDLKKQLIELNAKTEVEKQKGLLDLQLKELEKIKKANGEKSTEYRTYQATTLAQFKAYTNAILAENEKLTGITLKDSFKNTNDKVERNANRSPLDPVEVLSNTDKINIDIQKDIEKINVKPIVVPIEINPKPIDRNTLQLRVDDAFIAVQEQIAAGQTPNINFLDAVLGDGFTDAISGASDAILNMVKETKVKELDSQLEFLDQLDERSTEVIELAQARIDDINDKLSSSDATSKELQNAKKNATESELNSIADKLEKERVKRNQLAAEKRKEDDRIKKAQQDQLANEAKRVDLEKQRQKEIEKTNKVLAITKAVNDAINAGLALQAAFEAIKSGSKIPFPANVAAIAIALAATVGAIASARSAMKFEAGGKVPVDQKGVAVGSRHTEGGIPFTVRGEQGFEMEGGEHITRRAATARNLEALDTINRYGDAVKFKVVPMKGYYADGGTTPLVGNFSAISTSIKDTKQDDATVQVMQLLQAELPKMYDAAISLASRNISVGVDQISDQQERVKLIQSKGFNN